MNNYRHLPNNLILEQKRHKKISLSSLSTSLIFYVSLFLMTFTDFLYARFEMKQVTQVRTGIGSGTTTGTLLAFVIFVSTAFLIDKEFRRLLLGKTGIVYSFVVVFYAWMGWGFYGNNIIWLLRDLLIFLCPITGLAMFCIIANSYRPKIQLASLYTVFNLYIFYAISMVAEITAATDAGVTERITDNSVWRYFYFLLPVTAISIGTLCRQGWYWRILILGWAVIQFYCIGFLGATRSFVIVFLTLCIFSLFGLSYRISNGVLTNKLSLGQARKLIYLLLFISLFFLGSIFFIDSLAPLVTNIFKNALIIDRFYGRGQRSTELRIEELIEGIQTFQDGGEWLFGKGLGSTFFSILGYETNAFHLGIFTFILKGGLILFGLVVFMLYVKFPLLFIKCLMKPYALTPLKRTALLTVLPGTFAWALVLLMSGGYSNYNFLGLGFAFGAYLHIRKHGLGLFFK